MKRIIFILLLSVVVPSTYAYPKRIKDDVDLTVNGLVRYQSYTKDQIIRILGEPDTLQYGDMDIYLWFDYKDSNGEWQEFGFDELDNGLYKFMAISVTSSSYVFNEGIKIGDHISEVLKLPGSFLNYIDEDKTGGHIYWYGGYRDMNPEFWSYETIFCYNEDGIIWMVFTDYLP